MLGCSDGILRDIWAYGIFLIDLLYGRKDMLVEVNGQRKYIKTRGRTFKSNFYEEYTLTRDIKSSEE
jgi:hypothetical protein